MLSSVGDHMYRIRYFGPLLGPTEWDTLVKTLSTGHIGVYCGVL